MPVSNWNVTTINGVQYLVVEVAQFRIPLDFDPTSNMFIAVAAPTGGVGNFPALVKGDTGDAPTIVDTVIVDSLAYNDPTPDSATLVEIATDTYQLNLAIHRGEPGEQGAVFLLAGEDIEGAGSQQPGQILVVNPAANGFVFKNQRVCDRIIPATLNSTPSGNAGYTLGRVSYGPYAFDTRPEVEGYSVVTGLGSDVVVDLVARLSNTNPDGGETTGNEVGRAPGVVGNYPACQTLFAGPPPGSVDAYDRVPAGQIVTIFFRAERQAGASYFTTAATTTRFKVRPVACPTDLTA